MRYTAIALGLLASSLAPLAAAFTTILYEQFNTLPLSLNWTIGAHNGGSVSISSDTTRNYAGSAGSLKGTYPIATGDSYVWAAYDLSALALSDIYIEFRAKMPGAKQGLKFLKIFGGESGGPAPNYANTTFALDATGIDNGALVYAAFGDGSTTANDTANGVWLAGINDPDRAYHGIGRADGLATVSTPQNAIWPSSAWGTAWHHFRFHVKFNSGTSALNEVNDGELYVEIDGVVYVDASGLFNRHYTNAPIDRVEFFGWAQNGTTPFELWYDDIRITTGGFYEPP